MISLLSCDATDHISNWMYGWLAMERFERDTSYYRDLRGC